MCDSSFLSLLIKTHKIAFENEMHLILKKKLKKCPEKKKIIKKNNL